MSSNPWQLNLLAIQIDGLHRREELTLAAAVGIDSKGKKPPLAVVGGATENTATAQALLGRGLDCIPLLDFRAGLLRDLKVAYFPLSRAISGF